MRVCAAKCLTVKKSARAPHLTYPLHFTRTHHATFAHALSTRVRVARTHALSTRPSCKLFTIHTTLESFPHSGWRQVQTDTDWRRLCVHYDAVRHDGRPWVPGPPQGPFGRDVGSRIAGAGHVGNALQSRRRCALASPTFVCASHVICMAWFVAPWPHIHRVHFRYASPTHAVDCRSHNLAHVSTYIHRFSLGCNRVSIQTVQGGHEPLRVVLPKNTAGL